MSWLGSLRTSSDSCTNATIVPARTLRGLPVMRVLNRLALERGLPRILHTDNRPEFCGRAMLTWSNANGVTLRLIEPGKLNQKAYIESLNGRFRDEYLNEHRFTNLAHTEAVWDDRERGIRTRVMYSGGLLIARER